VFFLPLRILLLICLLQSCGTDWFKLLFHGVHSNTNHGNELGGFWEGEKLERILEKFWDEGGYTVVFVQFLIQNFAGFSVLADWIPLFIWNLYCWSHTVDYFWVSLHYRIEGQSAVIQRKLNWVWCNQDMHVDYISLPIQISLCYCLFLRLTEWKWSVGCCSFLPSLNLHVLQISSPPSVSFLHVSI
jgi:hypothetical protein